MHGLIFGDNYNPFGRLGPLGPLSLLTNNPDTQSGCLNFVLDSYKQRNGDQLGR